MTPKLSITVMTSKGAVSHENIIVHSRNTLYVHNPEGDVPFSLAFEGIDDNGNVKIVIQSNPPVPTEQHTD